VLWGTDAGWYGAPQWQIEAMRRLEIPDEMRRKHNFAALGPADGVVKTAIFGGNAARLYRINQRAALGEITRDKVAAIKAEYVAAGGMRSNRRYGYVHRATAERSGTRPGAGARVRAGDVDGRVHHGIRRGPLPPA